MLVLLFTCLSAACDSGPEPGPVRKEVIYFASDRGGGGNMNIWRMDPDGKNMRQVTHYATGDFWPADVSPDGKRLLFFRLDDHTLISSIYLMDAGGRSLPWRMLYYLDCLWRAISFRTGNGLSTITMSIRLIRPETRPRSCTTSEQANPFKSPRPVSCLLVQRYRRMEGKFAFPHSEDPTNMRRRCTCLT